MDDIGTVMNAAGSDAAALLSWGVGTPAAILFAATYPQRVDNLILINAYAHFLRNDALPWGYPPNRFSSYINGIQELWGTGLISRILAPSLVTSEESLRRWGRIERLSATPDVTVIPRSFMESDVTHVLESIQASTLIIARSDDGYIRHEHSSFLASQLPGAALVELPGSDDSPFAGQSNEIIDSVRQFIASTSSHPVLDRVLTTVMFTDIVASTEHAARTGDRDWTAILDAYDSLVHRELLRFRGKYVKSTGDGTLATFDGPARAIECARALAVEVKSLGIDIRAGLHTGEIELRGDDVAGLAVHIAARVSSLAGPGEVLVSRTVSDLVVGSSIAFRDRGGHPLKGVPDQWRIYGVEV
jgi:class 3 adenylate cyclase